MPRATTRSEPSIPGALTELFWGLIAIVLTHGLRLSGLLLMALAALLVIAFLTYDPSDPSYNTAASGQPPFITNWAGSRGAILADFLLQGFGVGAFILILGAAVQGRRLWLQRRMTAHRLRRFGFFILALLALAAASARIPSFGWLPQPYLGGSFGMILLNTLAAPTQQIFGPWVHTALAFFLAATAFVLACLALNIPIRRAIARQVALAIFAIDYARYAALCVYDAALWLRHRNDPAFVTENRTTRRRPQFEIEDRDSEEEAQDDTDEDGSIPMPRRPVQDIKVVRPALKPRKKATPKQMELGDADDFEIPSLDLLQEAPTLTDADRVDENALRKNADLLRGVLSDYHVRGDIVAIHPGPVVTLYELEPAPGTKSSRVIGLSNDIARSMAAVSVRASVIPGRNVIGIEIPNKKRQTVYLRELLTSEAYATAGGKLALVLGKDIGGHPIIADLSRMPHLLVAGTTGSGKSVAINTMILSLIYRLTPQQCRFIMIDPKMLELSVYDDIPHLLSPVVTEPGKAVIALKWAVQEMENRYRAMSKLGVRNIEGYNARLAEARRTGEVLLRKVQTGFDPETGEPVYEEQPLDLTELPYIVVIVDEFADLMLVAGKDVENAIQRLAQMARAAGIHLIMATQRPSVDVITGVIKANFPTRISFQVTSKIDSRTILGEGGAEQLLGMGDMLYMASGGRVTRVHGPFVADAEVEQVVHHLKAQGSPDYQDDVTVGDEDFGENGQLGGFDGGGAGGIDDLYDKAVAIVAREGRASTSFIQRHLQIGYNRAARIIEEMEKQGVVSPPSHAGKRTVLVGDHSGRH